MHASINHAWHATSIQCAHVCIDLWNEPIVSYLFVFCFLILLKISQTIKT